MRLVFMSRILSNIVSMAIGLTMAFRIFFVALCVVPDEAGWPQKTALLRLNDIMATYRDHFQPKYQQPFSLQMAIELDVQTLTSGAPWYSPC